MPVDNVNLHIVAPLTEKEVQPVDVTLTTFTPEEIAAGLLLDTAIRYDLSDPDDEGRNIAAVVSILGSVVTVMTLWDAGETPAEGNYQVEIVVKNTGGSRREETNLVYDIK